MNFIERLQQGIVVFDGAMGTQIQALNPSIEEWKDREGCLEILNLSVPDKIQHIHERYLEAGADVIETNTFGGSESVLDEFDLGASVREINRTAVEIARKAVDKYKHIKPRFIAGSIGPGTKLPILGQIDFDTLFDSYSKQIEGLMEGGADLLVIETCQDLLQIKSVIIAANDVFTRLKKRIPVIVSITVETNGTLLTGSSIDAVITALKPFNITALGMNCATGPEQMAPYLHQICKEFEGPVLCQPNAGLPENINGKLVYTLPVEEFVSTVKSYVTEYGVGIVGGCCGTSPAFTSGLNTMIEKNSVKKRTSFTIKPSVSSIFSSKSIKQTPPPFFVGERTNTNGSKRFKNLLLEENWDRMMDIARGQQLSGSHGLDICVAYSGRDEERDMKKFLKQAVTQIDLPFFIDSTNEKVIEVALKLYGGRGVINSINLENGEEHASKICKIAKKYGAALIALTIDEDGMAHSVEKKVEIAKRIYKIAVDENKLKPEDLIFDTLTFTLGSGDESLKTAAINTLKGIEEVKKALPGINTILGLSNISFGLSPDSREVLNAVFLAEAVKSGLDMAIINTKKIIPLFKIEKESLKYALNLIYNRGEGNPLFDYIKHFEKNKQAKTVSGVRKKEYSLPEKITQKIIQGSKSDLEDLLKEMLKSMEALDIINSLLISGMKTVGDLFGKGEMQLPFVLQSAEVMKSAVEILKPHMKDSKEEDKTSILLATVRGDVHDIGKNLVDIILSNNGYKVYNIGIKCDITEILKHAEELKVNAIGMSGLLVKSTVIMKENLEDMKNRNIDIPVLLGGAALTKDYVKEICDPIIEAPVFYCADAFDGLNAMEKVKDYHNERSN